MQNATGKKCLGMLLFLFAASLTYAAPQRVAHIPWIQNSNRTHSDIEGTRHIALLYYLAGTPQKAVLQKNESGQSVICLGIPQFVLVSFQHTFAEAQYRLAKIVRQATFLSSALVCADIPCGPPGST